MSVEGGGDYRQRLVQRQLQIKKRKKAGLSNTRADAGPPSSKTFSSPPKDEPKSMTESFATALGATAATKIGDFVHSDFSKKTGLVSGPTGIVGQKLSEILFPKYDKSAKDMSFDERKKATYNILELMPFVGDPAAISRSVEGVERDGPNIRSLGQAAIDIGLSIVNPVGSAQQVKAVAGEGRNILGDMFPSARKARPKPAAAETWAAGFEPLDLTIDTRSGEMSLETYKTAKAHYGDAFPDAEEISEDLGVAFVPSGGKMNSIMTNMLTKLPSNLIAPVSKEQIDATGSNGLIRIKEQYDSDEISSGILGTYGVTRRDPVVPKVTDETVERMRGTFETDYGQAYRYDPVTGEERITNNEHVFAVSGEALRHNFEIRQLEQQLKAQGANKKEIKKALESLVDKQRREMGFALDPNRAMVILSAPTNQNIVGSLDPSQKQIAIARHDPGGMFGTTVPRRLGEEKNWMPNQPVATIAAYQDVIDSADTFAPGLVSDTATAFRNAYADRVKPLRNQLIRVKDPKVKKELSKRLYETEQELWKEFYA